MRAIFLAIFTIGLVSRTTAEEWTVFRGNPEQNGVAPGRLPNNLEQRWRVKVGDSVEGGIAVSKGVVYFGSYDQHLYAVDANTGKEVWKKKLAPMKGSPSIHKDRVYIGDTDGKFYCLNQADGERIWTFDTEGEITAGANFYEDKILIGSHDSTLYCLNSEGKKVWDFKIEGPVNGSPAIVEDKTFVAGCDSRLHIVDIKSGKGIISIDLDGQSGATAAVKGTGLYVGTMNNQVLGIDIKTQKVTWRYEHEKSKFPFYSSAAVTDDLVIVGGRDKRIHALDRKTGNPRWTYLTEGKIDSSPLVIGDRVVAGSMDNHVYVLDIQKGAEIQKIELDSPILASPAIVDGRLFVATEKYVYCYGAKKAN